MHARSTTIQGSPSQIDAGIRFVTEEVMPAITQIDGCIGLSMLVDRQSGRCIATSAWTDEQSMRASDNALRPMRERAAQVLGGGPQVEEWEIAVLHRDHRTSDSSCARCTWVQVDPARVDGLVQMYRSQVLPAVEGMDGFCSASLLVNRQTGRVVGTVSWDSREALDRSRDATSQLRTRVTQEAGADVLEVAEFDLALAHLRVPELV